MVEWKKLGEVCEGLRRKQLTKSARTERNQLVKQQSLKGEQEKAEIIKELGEK